jgi:hypothetical protein
MWTSTYTGGVEEGTHEEGDGSHSEEEEGE